MEYAAGGDLYKFVAAKYASSHQIEPDPDIALLKFELEFLHPVQAITDSLHIFK